MLYALNMICARTMELTRLNVRYSKFFRCTHDVILFFCRLHFVFSVFYVLCSRIVVVVVVLVVCLLMFFYGFNVVYVIMCCLRGVINDRPNNNNNIFLWCSF